jgi:hypothetical protein
MKGVFPWLVGWDRRVGTRYFCLAFAALVNAVQNIFFLTVQYFTSCVTLAQQAVQAVVLGNLSLNICLWTMDIYNILPPPCKHGNIHIKKHLNKLDKLV